MLTLGLPLVPPVLGESGSGCPSPQGPDDRCHSPVGQAALALLAAAEGSGPTQGPEAASDAEFVAPAAATEGEDGLPVLDEPHPSDAAPRDKVPPEPDRPPPSLGTPLPDAPITSSPMQGLSPVAPGRSPGAGPTPLPSPIAPGAQAPPTPVLPLPSSPAEELPPLTPTVVAPARPDDSREPIGVAPPRDTDTPAPPYRGEDPALYQDLPWDFCGPRVGGAGLGGITEPTTPSDTPVDAVADRADYDREQELVTLMGSVQFTQGDQILRAERSTYDRRSGGVEAEGDVYVEYPGGRLTADSGRYFLQTKEGELENVGFRFSGNANLRGTAERAELLAGDRTRYRDVTYTTCPPGRSDWSLRASDLLLDHADGMGSARHARIRLAGVPVLYSPYLRFPIDDRRRSGFLIPSVGSSSLNGTEITIPYYWNIAPNYDATFYPRLMSSRGLMLGAQFRHLASFQKLEVNGEVIPNDTKSEDEKTRGAIRIEQTGQLGPRWSTAVDYSSVTDDRYLADFGNRLDLTSLRNLPQRGDLRYAGDGYWWLARVQDFQTLDPTIPAEGRPYAQYPHVELNLGPTRSAGFADLALKAQYDYFDHSAKVHGSRVVALPSVQAPLRRSFGHLIPRARLYYTGYELSDVAPGVASQQSHLIPSLDLDGKLIFERDTQWFGSPVLQTLEPRLYYVLTTYEDQSTHPSSIPRSSISASPACLGPTASPVTTGWGTRIG
jgi:LPS-assembly protein